jgi:large subunit ribosomal protein L17
MRHRVAGAHLNRTSAHRLALRRNLASSLFEHETISTTIQKAKNVRGFAEKMITLAKKGDLASRRRVISLLNNRAIYENQEGQMVKTGTVVGKLFSELGPRYLDRPGGYTRIIRLAKRRLGDNGQLVLLQLVGRQEEEAKEPSKARKKGRGKKRSKADSSGS